MVSDTMRLSGATFAAYANLSMRLKVLMSGSRFLGSAYPQIVSRARGFSLDCRQVDSRFWPGSFETVYKHQWIFIWLVRAWTVANALLSVHSTIVSYSQFTVRCR